MKPQCIRSYLCQLCLIMIALMLCACSHGGAKSISKAAAEWTAQNAAGTVQDTITIPQHLGYFASMLKTGLPQSEEQSHSNAERFLQRIFSPWHDAIPVKHVCEQMRKILSWSPKYRGFAENLNVWSESDWMEMVLNANFDSAEGKCRPAITVHDADLRLAPTMRPRFARLEGAGQGYPFDDFQQTSLHAGTPLAIVHESKDGAWLLAVSALASGWIKAEHIAFADANFCLRWEHGPFLTFMQDDISLIAQGSYWGKVSIGAILPVQGTDRKSVV